MGNAHPLQIVNTVLVSLQMAGTIGTHAWRWWMPALAEQESLNGTVSKSNEDWKRPGACIYRTQWVMTLVMDLLPGEYEFYAVLGDTNFSKEPARGHSFLRRKRVNARIMTFLRAARQC